MEHRGLENRLSGGWEIPDRILPLPSRIVVNRIGSRGFNARVLVSNRRPKPAAIIGLKQYLTRIIYKIVTKKNTYLSERNLSTLEKSQGE
jgi:hypothetical protein